LQLCDYKGPGIINLGISSVPKYNVFTIKPDMRQC